MYPNQLVIVIQVIVLVTDILLVVLVNVVIHPVLVTRGTVHVMGIIRGAVGTAQTLIDVCHTTTVPVMDTLQDAPIVIVIILVKMIVPAIVMVTLPDAPANVIQIAWLTLLVAVMDIMQDVQIAILIMNVNVILSVQIVQQIMVNEL